MRIFPLLMLTLLLIGFSARPTVASALTSGQVQLHPIQTVAMIDQAAELHDAHNHGPHLTMATCVSLGILPSGWAAAPRHRVTIFFQYATAGQPSHRAYGILRPPRA